MRRQRPVIPHQVEQRRRHLSGHLLDQLFRRQQQLDPYLDADSRAERRAEEEALIHYAVFLHSVMHRQVGTIKQKLFAIRHMRLALGYHDPLLAKPRLHSALSGMFRDQGPPRRKRPVTVKMLLWIRTHLDQSDASGYEKARVWAALMMGFFFLLKDFCPESCP